MEDTIRKIMDNELMGDAGDSERCAVKIADNFERFFEWFVFGSHPFIDWYESETDKFFTDEVSDKKLTTEELYQYWLLNVKDK